MKGLVWYEIDPISEKGFIYLTTNYTRLLYHFDGIDLDSYSYELMDRYQQDGYIVRWCIPW